MRNSNFQINDKKWIDEEVARTKFRDERLGKRFRRLVGQLSEGIGESLPLACQDWANTKAAYRFLSNRRVCAEDILTGHFLSTRKRFSEARGKILVLHDTTSFSYQRQDPQLVGMIGNLVWKERHAPHNKLCGIFMHSSLAVTTDGLPLGLAAVKHWSRKEFKGCNALKKKINPTRMSIDQKESIRWLENIRQSTQLLADPDRCIHIGDRESDIFELFCTAEELGTCFLVRTCVNRLAGDGDHTIYDEMKENPIRGVHRVQVRDKNGAFSQAIVEMKYRRIKIFPPIGKQNQYPKLMLTVIHAQERGNPKDREKIDWKLMTNLPVQSRQEAIEKLDWYSMRWKIETFHKILKSGCKIEELKLRTAQRLVNLISVFCILSWRIFWMTIINRVAQDASPKLALTNIEISLLDHLVKSKAQNKPPKTSLSAYITKIARLGGYLARKSDPPPGIKVMWKGISRLTDIELGFILGAKLVGN